MNNAKLWLVVKPTTGLPIFLSAVAISSFAVHVGILNTTSWVSDYHKGLPLGTGDKVAALGVPESAGAIAPAAFEAVEEMGEGDRFTVVLPDGRRAVAVIENSTVLAKASGRHTASD